MSDLTAPLLIEIGCEELPAGLQESSSSYLGWRLFDLLSAQQLVSEGSSVVYYSTPRRFACRIEGVAPESEPQSSLKLGPPTGAAYDSNGNPSPAATGFARSVNAEVQDLQKVDTDKGERLAYKVTVPGQTLSGVLQEALPDIIKSMDLPKTMRWGSGDDRFIRPVHWLLCLHGDQLIRLNLFNLSSADQTYGHRIHSGPEPISISNANDYQARLLKAHVIASRDDRKNQIEQFLQSEVNPPQDNFDELLIGEVADLTEWPQGLVCSFDKAFLDVPDEVLVLSMKTHQKFFPLFQKDGSLSNQFVAFANIESKQPDEVRSGFERVIRPRLADAKFFWDQDRKQPLEQYFAKLEKITFQQQLGSIADKARRTQQLASKIAEKLNIDPTSVARAAELSLCDLATDMVGEFPELQGVMGMYYAKHSGESDDVAEAIEQQYWPLPLPSDESVANTATAQILVIAERTDRLLGIFAVGKKPTGNKDPFALRRAAFALIKTIQEAGFVLPLDWLFSQARIELEKKIEVSDETYDDVVQFILDRLQTELAPRVDKLHFRAISANRITDVIDFRKRAEALLKMPEKYKESLAAANKRARNLLRKTESNIDQISADIFEIDAERVLFEEISSIENVVRGYVDEQDYLEALIALSRLKAPLDAFFEDVMVMSDNPKLRDNRLAMLAHLQALCGQVAAFDELAV